MFLLSALLAVWAGGQAAAIPNLGDTTSPAPTTPGHALITGPHETVNPANGSVTFAFPVALPRGRGFTPAFNISYSSAGAHPFTSSGNEVAIIAGQSSLLSSDGWSSGAPVLTYSVSALPSKVDPQETCNVSTGYVVEMPDGERQQFNLSLAGRTGAPPQGDNPCDSGQNYPERTSDTSGGWTAVTNPIVDYTWQRMPVTVTSPATCGAWLLRPSRHS